MLDAPVSTRASGITTVRTWSGVSMPRRTSHRSCRFSTFISTATRPVAAVLSRRAVLAAGLAVALALRRLQERLAAQLDPVLVVDRDHLHLHPVADLHHVVHPADVPGVQLGDVTQPVPARGDLDERP